MSKRSEPIHLLAVGPLPPPVGGDTVLFSRIAKSPFWAEKQVEVDILDSSRKSDIRLTNEPVIFSDLFHVAKLFLSFIFKSLRCDQVLICANSRFLFTVGLGFIIIARLLRKTVLIKPFGGTLDIKYENLFSLHRYLVRHILNFAHVMLPETKALKNILEQNKLSNNNHCVWFPNFIADSHWPSDEITYSRPRPQSIVYISHIKREKGVFKVLDLLKENNNINGAFYGPILPRDKEEFLDKVSSLPNADYGGILNVEEVLNTIAKHAILVLPTAHDGEGYPGILLEAMACGRPVVSTRWKAIPELVQDGIDGSLVELDDQEQFSDAVLTILNNSDKWHTMCKQARKSASRFREKPVLAEILLPLIMRLGK